MPLSSILTPSIIPSIPAGIRSSKIYGFNLINKNPDLASAYPWSVFVPPFERARIPIDHRTSLHLCVRSYEEAVRCDHTYPRSKAYDIVHLAHHRSLAPGIAQPVLGLIRFLWIL